MWEEVGGPTRSMQAWAAREAGKSADSAAEEKWGWRTDRHTHDDAPSQCQAR